MSFFSPSDRLIQKAKGLATCQAAWLLIEDGVSSGKSEYLQAYLVLNSKYGLYAPSMIAESPEESLFMHRKILDNVSAKASIFGYFSETRLFLRRLSENYRSFDRGLEGTGTEEDILRAFKTSSGDPHCITNWPRGQGFDELISYPEAWRSN